MIEKINVLLLENIHTEAIKMLENNNFRVHHYNRSLDRPDLIQTIKDENIQVLGIRSATHLTKEFFEKVGGVSGVSGEGKKNLLCIGCFCIGTNQVDLDTATSLGIPVFNSPFCNSRSVAELTIAQIINLSRGIHYVSAQMRAGNWLKSSTHRHEVRGKTLGIIGYGNIGTQVSVLAESLGMNVVYYDVVPKLPIGNAKSHSTLEELLTVSDFVTLHVPQSESTKNMITLKELGLMKNTSYLLNASRGTVVNLKDLCMALDHKIISGGWLDVYPKEPLRNGMPLDEIIMKLTRYDNVILTPHIGGATEEAQYSIAIDTTSKLINYVKTGSTIGSVNFPEIAPKIQPKPRTHRITSIHKNVHGVLRKINEVMEDFNISSQQLSTNDTIGYLIVDVEFSEGAENSGESLKTKISQFNESISTRYLF